MERGFKRHAIAGRQPADAGTELHHFAGRLMPEHEGVFHHRVADAPINIIVDIAAANAHGTQAHNASPGPGTGTGTSTRAICPMASSWPNASWQAE